MEYTGSASSHFQAEPIMYDARGERLPPLSDWELHLAQHPSMETPDLPRFLTHKNAYTERSRLMGENMVRISLDFARLCPSSGEFNHGLMAEYVEALALIRARGMEPMLTLHHFTMPLYLVETSTNGNVHAGGWEHPDVAKRFRFYVEHVLQFLNDLDRLRPILAKIGLERRGQDQFLSEGLVNYFISLNEPATMLFNGYLAGVFPPFKRGRVITAARVLERMVEAHDATYETIKRPRPGLTSPQMGAAYNWQYFDGALGSVLDEVDPYYTNKFERDGAYSDFLGLQYYFRVTTPLLPGQRSRRDYGDHPAFGDVYPPGILEVMKKMHVAYPQKNIFLTEFGFSDTTDRRRPYWILETVRYVLEAKRLGIPIKGMLLWSLVNNFEWDLGMTQRFGLFDENELHHTPKSVAGQVQSWEIWKAVLGAIMDPTEERIVDLEELYDHAKRQHDEK